VIYPASRGVLLEALKEGVLETLLKAGASIGPPGCGFCIGRTVALGDGEVALSTQTETSKAGWATIIRSFTCRVPSTAAASAIGGKITDPRGLER